MEITGKLKHLHISPRKVRLVADLVRKLPAIEALNQLKFMNKNAALPISKLIASAIASAKHNFEIEADNLFIKEIKVDEGTTMKRWMPKAHGRATPIMKRMSHINLILGEIKDSGVKTAKKQKLDKPIKLDAKLSEQEPKKIVPKDEKKDKLAEDAKEGEIVDPRMEGRHGHAKIEGKTSKGFTSKMFRRKSG